MYDVIFCVLLDARIMSVLHAAENRAVRYHKTINFVVGAAKDLGVKLSPQESQKAVMEILRHC